MPWLRKKVTNKCIYMYTCKYHSRTALTKCPLVTINALRMSAQVAPEVHRPEGEVHLSWLLKTFVSIFHIKPHLHFTLI